MPFYEANDSKLDVHGILTRIFRASDCVRLARTQVRFGARMRPNLAQILTIWFSPSMSATRDWHTGQDSEAFHRILLSNSIQCLTNIRNSELSFKSLINGLPCRA